MKNERPTDMEEYVPQHIEPPNFIGDNAFKHVSRFDPSQPPLHHKQDHNTCRACEDWAHNMSDGVCTNPAVCYMPIA